MAIAVGLSDVILQLVPPREWIVANNLITSTSILWAPEHFLLDSMRSVIVS